MTSWSRVFPGRPAQVAQARQFVASVLAGRAVDGAELVVSELATNAVAHTASGGPDGLFVVSVSTRPDAVTISVQDMGSADHRPEVTHASDGEPADCGRGLVLVAALSKEWGTTRTPLGWRVWAVLADDGGKDPAHPEDRAAATGRTRAAALPCGTSAGYALASGAARSGGRELPLPHGYTIGQLRLLALAAVCHDLPYDGQGFHERARAAWLAIGGRIFASGARAPRGELIEIGREAIRAQLTADAAPGQVPARPGYARAPSIRRPRTR